jgi:hypothetical protein
MAEPSHPLSPDGYQYLGDTNAPPEADSIFVQGDSGFSSQLFSELDGADDSLLEVQNDEPLYGNELQDQQVDAAAAVAAQDDPSISDDWQDVNVNVKWTGKRRTRYASTVSKDELQALTEQSSC